MDRYIWIWIYGYTFILTQIHINMDLCINLYIDTDTHGYGFMDIQPIADRVALNLEIILKTFSTNQNSAHGIYDEYQVINYQSHENPGTPGTKSKVLEIISRCCATLSAIGCICISTQIHMDMDLSVYLYIETDTHGYGSMDISLY